MCHQIIFKARHPGTLWGCGEERIDAVSGVAPTNVDMRTHLVHVCKCTCASHSLPCDLHESQRVAFPPSRSSSQTSWCIRNTRRAGHNAGEMPFRQLQQGTGFHTLEDMQSLKLFLALQGKGLTSAWVHVQPVCIGWLLRKIQQVRICQKIESSHPQGVPGL